MKTKKTNTRKTTTKSTARGKAKAQGHDHAKMSADIKTQTAQIKLLKGNDLHRRPPNNAEKPKAFRLGVLPNTNHFKKNIVSYQMKKNNKNYSFLFGKTLSYTA